MTPALLYSLVIQPVVAELNWPQPTEREVLLLAIAIQESELLHRVQRPRGPARSFWQIEPPTAIDCCLRCELARNLCAEIGMEYGESDLASCVIAAGILRLTRGKLPKVGDAEKAWEYYLKAWRPGKPNRDWRLGDPAPERWLEAYKTAVKTAKESSRDPLPPHKPPVSIVSNNPLPSGTGENTIIPAADNSWAPNT